MRLKQNRWRVYYFYTTSYKGLTNLIASGYVQNRAHYMVVEIKQ